MTLLAGYELTFTNRELIEAGAARGELEADTPENITACAAFAAAVRRSIGDHAYAVEDDGTGFARHVLTYNDGYWVKVEVDPWVIEITGQPLTLAEYRANAPRFEQLFETARRLGLAPHHRIGGGHVHLDRASFGSPTVLRNFIVDYVNRPELALGDMGFDLMNAPPLALAPRASIEAFAEGLAAFDAGKLDLEAWLRYIRSQVYTYASRQLPEAADRTKFQALNVSHSSTIEIRAIRPQQSFTELLSIIERFEKRVAELACGPLVELQLDRRV